MTLTAFAATEHLTPSSASRLVAGLEDAGYILRRSDPSDGRVVRLEITDNGRTIVARNREFGGAYIGAALMRLSEENLEILLKALPVLSELVEGGDGPPVAPDA
jgi:DNA-binding MarR family transcriptional regulator